MNSFKKGATSILVLFIAYALLWPDLFLPQQPFAVFSTAWFAFAALKGALRTVAVLWIGRRFLTVDFPLPETILPKLKDLLNGLGIGACLSAVALGAALFALALGVENPLLALFPHSAPPAFSGLVLMTAACLGTGYSEELFFRFFAVGTLEKAGFPSGAAYLISACVFAFSHLGQGIFGAVTAGIFALILSFFRIRGSKLHVLALGHATYNLAVLLVVAFA